MKTQVQSPVLKKKKPSMVALACTPIVLEMVARGCLRLVPVSLAYWVSSRPSRDTVSTKQDTGGKIAHQVKSFVTQTW